MHPQTTKLQVVLRMNPMTMPQSTRWILPPLITPNKAMLCSLLMLILLHWAHVMQPTSPVFCVMSSIFWILQHHFWRMTQFSNSMSSRNALGAWSKMNGSRILMIALKTNYYLFVFSNKWLLGDRNVARGGNSRIIYISFAWRRTALRLCTVSGRSDVPAMCSIHNKSMKSSRECSHWRNRNKGSCSWNCIDWLSTNEYHWSNKRR